MRKIYIVGIGMGNSETLTLAGHRIIKDSDAIVGAKRMLDSCEFATGERYYAVDSQHIVDWILTHEEYASIGVLMSGDVGFFSGAKKLIAMLEKFDVELIPGISSLQYLSAKLKMPWEDAKIISLHGRDANMIGEVQTNEKTFILTGADHSAKQICIELVENGLGNVMVHVGERLSYEDECITKNMAKELKDKDFHPLSVIMVENSNPIRKLSVTHGIEDECFLRGKVPMTKCEVRSVTLSKLSLCENDIIYDVGAGTGSVSVEMSLQANKGQVYAIEASAEAISLIHENKEKFGTSNLHIISGMAPEALADLPRPDKAFIGGTKGNLEGIISVLLEKNPFVHIVINAIAIETMCEAMQCLNKFGFENVDVVQIFAARGIKAGEYHLMTGQNPVYIISAKR